jgi:hypothetical protein
MGDLVRAGRTYVASRAGFDATNLALGAHGLLPVIERMFGIAEPHYDYRDFAARERVGTVSLPTTIDCPPRSSTQARSV